MRAVSRALAAIGIWTLGVGIFLPSSFFLLPLFPAFAQDASIHVSDSRVDYTYGQQVTFTLTADAPSDIQSVTLFFRPAHSDNTTVKSLAITPGLIVNAAYTHDIRNRALPPFGPVSYWWKIEAAGLAPLTTPPASFTYEDNRFLWQTLSRPPVFVHWHAGNNEFGQNAVDIASASLTRIARDLNAPLPERLDVYLYAETDALQTGLRLAGRTWAGGHADPELGVLLASVPPGLESRLEMGRELPHELAHMLIYQIAGPEYANLPNWLNEGLASFYEEQPSPEYSVALVRAAEAETLLPFPDLCASFPLDPAEALLAYAQSESLVRYIREQYGPAGFTNLLQAYASGASCASGVERALGLSLDRLAVNWQKDVFHANPLRGALRALGPWAALAAFLLVPAVLIPFITRRATQ